ncbi:MAG: nicotinate-nucleotide diphosphorylase (carboxylating) [Planctomycetes bacterium]|jgi:nicotinate-nucleotide pyrophosphorylase (carboxylating)|nr:nicotinate-nucleotide diphosphorylase (carboxylating) [Planctomycetota bacterium]
MQRLEPSTLAELDPLLDAALAEDIGAGDVTSTVIFPADARAGGRLVARVEGVLSGMDVFRRVFQRIDPLVVTRSNLQDGDRVHPGEPVCELEGSVRALLTAERTALNWIQRLSGIATLTRRFVDAGGGVRVLDTRKTTPGLRRLEKYAVLCGGGENHRFGLFDQAMVKDNHSDLCEAGTGALVERLRKAHGPDLVITAEARNEGEARSAIEAEADVVLLDNFEPEELARLVPRLRVAAESRSRALELEASGGIRLDNVARFAATGVDRVSIGALTHSAPALDLALELWNLGERGR